MAELCVVDVAIDNQREGSVQKWSWWWAEFHPESESVSVHVFASAWPADWQEGGASWCPPWGLLTHYLLRMYFVLTTLSSVNKLKDEYKPIAVEQFTINLGVSRDCCLSQIWSYSELKKKLPTSSKILRKLQKTLGLLDPCFWFSDVVVSVIGWDYCACIGSAISDTDLRCGRDGDIQDLPGVLECTGVGAVPRQSVCRFGTAVCQQTSDIGTSSTSAALHPCPVKGTAGDDIADGEARGSAGGWEWPGRGGAWVHEGHRLHQPLQEHAWNSRYLLLIASAWTMSSSVLWHESVGKWETWERASMCDFPWLGRDVISFKTVDWVMPDCWNSVCICSVQHYVSLSPCGHGAIPLSPSLPHIYAIF